MPYGISYRLHIQHLEGSNGDEGWFYDLTGERLKAHVTGIVHEQGEPQIQYLGGDTNKFTFLLASKWPDFT